MTTTVSFQAMKNKQDPLVFASLNSLLVAHLWTPGADYIPSSLTDSTSGLLKPLSTGWSTLGEVQKKAGVSLTPNLKTSDVEGLGSMAPRRTLKTNEGIDIDFTAQEWRKINMSIFYGTDLSTVWADTLGQWVGHKSASPIQQYFSLIVMGRDTTPDGDIYPYWIFPKVAVTKIGKTGLNDGQEIEFPSTLSIYEDSDYVSGDGTVGPLYDFGVAGPGNLTNAQTGGFVLPTSITVTPATFTISHTVSPETQQLTVKDNENNDVTAFCTFSSGTPADATVSSSGLVTAVATGSSVITVSYTPSGGGSALTSTATATVS